MAKGTTGSNIVSTRRKPATRPAASIGIMPDFMGLLSCAYRVEPKTDEALENKHIMDCISAIIDWDEEEYILGFTTEIRALKFSTNDGKGFISATYLTTLKLDRVVRDIPVSEQKEIAKVAINLSVLREFKGLYDNIKSQSVATFVELPTKIEPIRWMSVSAFEKQILPIPMPRTRDEKKKTATAPD